ncbi:hypothetical protein AURDEDRAFT_130839 [Auricularia subglabra TFB-10046 SS5]|uniref:Uncharacterized protein n=1 Tax=Auricularia subglabra (strain TFB-10046 / SS5) TaxID=717982 RepID=J0WSD7_AURST|nr:hypothetical protein AURDEDRAFT_130839 [Auricularia subglabra TFB-10046 SS5]
MDEDDVHHEDPLSELTQAVSQHDVPPSSTCEQNQDGEPAAVACTDDEEEADPILEQMRRLLSSVQHWLSHQSTAASEDGDVDADVGRRPWHLKLARGSAVAYRRESTQGRHAHVTTTQIALSKEVTTARTELRAIEAIGIPEAELEYLADAGIIMPDVHTLFIAGDRREPMIAVTGSLKDGIFKVLPRLKMAIVVDQSLGTDMNGSPLNLQINPAQPEDVGEMFKRRFKPWLFEVLSYFKDSQDPEVCTSGVRIFRGAALEGKTIPRLLGFERVLPAGAGRDAKPELLFFAGVRASDGSEETEGSSPTTPYIPPLHEDVVLREPRWSREDGRSSLERFIVLK